MVLCGFNTGLYGLWVPGMFRFMPPENVTKDQIPIIYQIMVSTIITIHYKESFSHNEVISPWRNHKDWESMIRKTSRQKMEPDKHKIYYFLTLYHILLFDKNYKYTNIIPIKSVSYLVIPNPQRDLPQAKFEMNTAAQP